jgi:hypothetical protein
LKKRCVDTFAFEPQAAATVPNSYYYDDRNYNASGWNFVETHGFHANWWTEFGGEYRVTMIDGSYLSGSLNLSSLNKLTHVHLSHCQLTSLNVSGLMDLEELVCNVTQLTSLNVSGLTNLKTLDCNLNSLTSLNVSGLMNLETLHCNYNQLTSLNVSGLTNLKYLQCNYNQLTSLDVSCLTNLEGLACYENLLTFTTLPHPSIFTGLYDDYIYFPQGDIPISEDGFISRTNFNGLQSQYNAGGGTTTYTWYYYGGGIVSSSLITNINGVLTFDESLNGKKNLLSHDEYGIYRFETLYQRCRSNRRRK